MVKSWLVVTAVFSLLLVLIYLVQQRHDSWALSALLAVVSLVISLAVGERAYRVFADRNDGNGQGSRQ
jgi:hypothetical protein